jgi:hypothetical protein
VDWQPLAELQGVLGSEAPVRAGVVLEDDAYRVELRYRPSGVD